MRIINYMTENKINIKTFFNNFFSGFFMENITMYKRQATGSNLKVHTTTDYHLFKSIDGNRTKNQLHLTRLKKSMSEHYLFTVIVVNERYEIIDGQHRFECIRELQLPLNYIVCKGYGLDEVHILNQNAKVWNADDYLEGYCKLGLEDYKIYREFKNKYKVGHSECMGLLTGASGLGSRYKPFHNGQFKVTNLSGAVDVMEKVLLIEPYYKGVRRRTFIFAIDSLLKNENFEFSEFIQKLKLQPSALHDCININQYKLLIESIYNYHRKDKVNLRF